MLAVGIHRHDVSIARGLVGNAVTCIVEYHVQVALIGIGNVLDVRHGRQHRTKSDVVILPDVLSRNAQRPSAILGHHLRIIAGIRYISHLGVFLISYDNGKGVVVAHGRCWNICID